MVAVEGPKKNVADNALSSARDVRKACRTVLEKTVVFHRVKKTFLSALFEDKLGLLLSGEVCNDDCGKQGSVEGERESLVLGAGRKDERA